MGRHRDHEDIPDDQLESMVRDLPWVAPPGVLRARVLARASAPREADSVLPLRLWLALAVLVVLALLDMGALARQNAVLRGMPGSLVPEVIVQGSTGGREQAGQQVSQADAAWRRAVQRSGCLQVRTAMIEALQGG